MNIDLLKQLASSPIYLASELPSTIGYAIYSYGSNDIRVINAFIDTSENNDGSEGYIITPTAIYYPGNVIKYDQITSLKLVRHHLDPHTCCKINHTIIDDPAINDIKLLELLSNECDITVLLEGTTTEKIEYDIQSIVHDLKEEVYEDVTLTNEQEDTLNTIQEDLESISTLDQENYNYELEQLCPKAYRLFNDLELDSDEMDELEKIMAILEEKQKAANAKFDQASRYYEDMINNLRNGNPAMYNQMKSMMKMVGLDEEELKNKSPEELNEMLDSLCKRYGISREQVENFARKFQQ